MKDEAVNLDHDYCTGKASKTPRKAIEISIGNHFVQKILKTTSYVKNRALPPSDSAGSLDIKQYHQIESELVPNVSVAPVKRKLGLNEYFERRQVSSETHITSDPILEAKRKVLRRQELKKKALMQESEPKIYKVPFMPILSLAEMTGIKELENQSFKMVLNPNYEEIVVLSTGCNTDITIPPKTQSANLLNHINDKIRVMSKSDKSLPDNSLISSIQETVLKKTASILTPSVAGIAPSVTPNKPKDVKLHVTMKQHGEDKIIMHLKKDRKRPDTKSIAVQTIELDHFPPFTIVSSSNTTLISRSRSKTRSKYEHKSRRRCISSRSGSLSSSSSCSSYKDQKSKFKKSRNVVPF